MRRFCQRARRVTSAGVGLPRAERGAKTTARLTVVIQLELGRNRPQPDVVGFVLALVGDPRIDQVVREHISLHQERAVGVERVERGVKRARHGGDLGELLENSGSQLGSMFDDYQQKARATISARIDSLAPPGLLTGELGPDDVTDVLFSAAVTWKQTVTTRAEFRDRVRRAVRLICRAD